MNGIQITIHGAERYTQFYSPVVPPKGSDIYIAGYYYTIVDVEYAITDSRENNHKLEVILKVKKLDL